MMQNNKNSKDQRTARTVKLKQKIEAINQHSHQFSQLYFQFPEPQNINNTSKIVMSPAKVPQEKSNTVEIFDSRRNTIKQKIKFRIKQELWNMLKKNSDKQQPNQPFCENIPSFSHKQTDKSNSFVYIKGRSFTRFDRDSPHSKKKWSMVSMACIQQYKRPKTERQNTPNEKKTNSRRVWSSVKMRQSDRAQFINKTNKMHKTSFSLQKFQVLQIQPWKLAQDLQNHLLID